MGTFFNVDSELTYYNNRRHSAAVVLHDSCEIHNKAMKLKSNDLTDLLFTFICTVRRFCTALRAYFLRFPGAKMVYKRRLARCS